MRHKVWLHIGMPKTGTSAVQTVMYANRERLAGRGYFYPDLGDKQHVALVRELARRAGSPVPFPRSGECGEYGRFTDLLNAEGGKAHTSIISSEYFFQRPGCLPGHAAGAGEAPLDLIRRTVDEAAAWFEGCDVHVLLWARRQDNWLISMYNQTVKSSLYAGEFGDYVENTVGARIWEIVALWVERFGRERVLCRSYDALSKQKQNIVESFLGIVCPDVSADELEKVEGSRNISLSNDALWLKKRINQALTERGGPVGRPLQRRIRKALLELTGAAAPSQRPFLSNAERRALMARYLPGNERLISDLGYQELMPLVEIDDLDRPSPTGDDASTVTVQSLDQVIQTLFLAAPGRRKRGRKAPGGGAMAGVSQ